MPDGDNVLSPVGQHEFTAEDRTGSHRLVATSMLVTAIIIAVRQAWWKKAQDFVIEKTHPSTTEGQAATRALDTQNANNLADTEAALKWMLGLGGTWIILSLMVDLGDTADLAVALGLVIMGSVMLEYGPDVFTELGISTSAPGSK